MSSISPALGSSSSTTLNSTSWTNNLTISTDAVTVTGLSPIPFEILINVVFTVPNSSPGTNAVVNVYSSECEDGTHFDDNDQYSGSNNSQSTLRSPTNFKLLGSVAVNQNIVHYRVFRLWGGLQPSRKFGIILENKSGLTLTSPSVTYTAISSTVV